MGRRRATGPDRRRRKASARSRLLRAVTRDTIGIGTARRVQDLIAVFDDPGRLAVHFHDAYGQGLANVASALECDVTAAASRGHSPKSACTV